MLFTNKYNKNKWYEKKIKKGYKTWLKTTNQKRQNKILKKLREPWEKNRKYYGEYLR